MKNENMLSNVQIVKKAFETWKSKSNWLVSSLSILLMSIILVVVMFVATLVLGIVFGVGLYATLEGGIMDPKLAVMFFLIIIVIILLIIIPAEIFFTVGIIRAFINMQKTGKFKFGDMFSGFRGFGGATVVILIRLVIAIIALLPVSYMVFRFMIGITSMGYYSMSGFSPSLNQLDQLMNMIFNPYIIVLAIVLFIAYIIIEIMLSQALFLVVDDEQKISGLQAISKSIQLMKGYKFKYFLLTLCVELCIVGVILIPLYVLTFIRFISIANGAYSIIPFEMLFYIASFILNSFYVTVLVKFYLNLVYGEKTEVEIDLPLQQVPQLESTEEIQPNKDIEE